jgi:DNA-directed RNA polymerase subunit RPC12/RpoP
MGEPTIEVLCKHCGQTFTTFLQEMADKNAAVTCPCCGKNSKNAKDSQPSDAMPRAAQN